ncbi:MAG: YidB family protein [Alphaproteobacteria bacterium]
MDTQQLLALAANAFKSGAGAPAAGLDLNQIISALTNLLPGDSGQIDLAGLVSDMNAGGLMAMASSWLGDGGNANIGFDEVIALFGRDKISGFASQLGLGETDAVSGLQSALPELMDKASSGGDLVGDLASQMLGGGVKSFFS